eukprot:TRINITY_DN2803_c0_g1_i6.p1 TRINITY_DN2803_c0_g1~~TRINITY_DN2803_c0_g1_i6.p1  ORF type:complete len:280 (-),score=-6.20 TRINITY_DN2803_c0_g1_i6:18-857(-)
MWKDDVLQDFRAVGHNSIAVDASVAAVVVVLDVQHVDCGGKVQSLVHVTQPLTKVVVVTNVLLVSLEVDHVNFIEADKGDEQTDVALRGRPSGEVALSGKGGVQLVERVEQHRDSCIVCLLRLCKPALVDAVADGLVDEVVDLVDGGEECSWGQVGLRVLSDGIEAVVEEANDLGRLVVHNHSGDVVEQDGHGVASLEGSGVDAAVTKGQVVQITDRLEAMRLLRSTRERGIEDPSLMVIGLRASLGPHWAGHDQANRLLKPLNLAEREASRRPPCTLR